MKQSKESLIELLRTTIEAIENDDSFEGSINYTVTGREDFEVSAFIRVGNSMGQGGCILLERSDENEH